ncbi:MAG: sugar phosphate isomerase/epimerase [Flavihumibacter sp.]|nr:sugar phosphate isomerase/epimerase [Flavihumibacter sp.]
MQHTRRSFIKNTSTLLAGASLLNTNLGSFLKQKALTGIQLYSVRAEMMKDPLDTLKKLAGFGYKYVEHANYVNRKFYGYTAKEFKKVLSDLGMKMPSGHTVLAMNHWDDTKKDFTDSWKYTVEDAAVVGQTFVISPWLDEKWRNTYDRLKHAMEVFNKCGELCRKSGMKFGYHNHDFEFSQRLNNQTVYDIMLSSTDAKLVIQQLDTGNLYNGGAKAIDVVNQFPGRFASLHVKDEILASGGHEKYESTILGKGIVGVKDVIDICKKSGGTIHYIIEQEAYQGKSPLECAKENIAIMKDWGY